jgi:hypothetical protein
MVFEADDHLVAVYDSLNELRDKWKQDACDFLGPDYRWSEDDWYPYFTCEDNNGDIQELSLSEILEGAA